MPAAGELRPILYGIMDLRILYHIERVGSKSVSEQSEREYDRWLLFTVVQPGCAFRRRVKWKDQLQLYL